MGEAPKQPTGIVGLTITTSTQEKTGLLFVDNERPHFVLLLKGGVSRLCAKLFVSFLLCCAGLGR